MRSGWKQVHERGTERRFEREDDPTIYVTIGHDGTISDEEFAQRVEDAMDSAEGPRLVKAHAPAGEMKGESIPVSRPPAV